MSINIYIEKKLGRNWLQKENIFFTGCFFYDEVLLSEDEVYEYLSKVTDFDTLKTLINHLSGFFSFIIRADDALFAAVDHVRSIPIFYTRCTESFLISNDAEHVRRIVGDTELDSVSVQEFVGNIVCGSETLFKNVKQIQAGEIIAVENASIKRYRYFSFTHSEKYTEHDADCLEEKLLEEFSRSIDKLIKYANGRQLVLPLSAGYDSRFIALMLYKKGIKNVLCYSYGEKGNYEAEISQQVAGALGFDWTFVEYTDELWYQWYRSDEYIRYLRMASGWVSLPHSQDWPAVWQLKIGKKVSDNAVFVAGYGGDAVAGSGIPFISDFNKRYTIKNFIRTLFILNYRNLQCLPKDIVPNHNRRLWRLMSNRVLDNLEIDSIETAQDFGNFKEKWDWLEYNPKFIVNAVRVYEFWGYDWYLPFPSKEFMNFWKNVPFELRYKKKMYDKVVDGFYTKLTNMKPPHYIPPKTTSMTYLRKIWEEIRFTRLHSMLINMRNSIKFRIKQNPGTNCTLGIFDEDFINKYSYYSNDANFLVSIDFLLSINKTIMVEL